MKRVFAFGCSYTSYSWPTWANFLELEFDELYNYGLSGIGNQAIAERVSEANARHHFTKDDVVIVQWSSHLRNDWWHQESTPGRVRGWKTYGSIFNYHNIKLYDQKWIDTFFYEPAYFMHTLNFISLTQGFLKGIGCKWFMTSIGDVRDMGKDLRDKDGYGEKTELVTNHKRGDNYSAWDMLPDLEIYDKTIWQDHAEHWLMPLELYCQSCPEHTFNFIDYNGTHYIDLHPSTIQHLGWIKQELKEKLKISDSTLHLAQELVDSIEPIYKKFMFDKTAFEFALGRKQGFPESCNKITWPGIPLGF
jgi:hypothetical protein